MQDYVIPSRNEQDFIDRAKKLSISSLVFLISYDEYTSKKPASKTVDGIKISYGILATKSNYLKCNSLRKRPLIVMKAYPEVRAVIERGFCDVFFGFESLNLKDYMHHRASGLNQVLCKLLALKKGTVCFSFSDLLHAKHKSLLLGRMMQNISLCKKYKVSYSIKSFATKPEQMRNLNDLSSLQRIFS